MCVPCHGAAPALAVRKTALGWAATVEAMQLKGAKGTDEQAEAAATYLSQHFAAVDVNTATAEALVRIAELSADDAAAIVASAATANPQVVHRHQGVARRRSQAAGRREDAAGLRAEVVRPRTVSPRESCLLANPVSFPPLRRNRVHAGIGTSA